MEYGQTSLDKLSADLAAIQEVSVRAALVKEQQGWVVHSAVIDSAPGSDPLAWSAYVYRQAAFVCGKTSGSSVGGWLRDGHGELTGHTFVIPPLQEQLGWRKYPSHTRYGFLRSNVPFTDYELIAVSGRPNEPTDFLVSDSHPFFPSFRMAVFTLLHDVTDHSQMGQFPNQVIDLRVGHTAAWIEKVHFTASSVTVELAGDDTDGARLQVVGHPDLRLDVQVQGAGEVPCLLPNGIPLELWIVLSRGDSWLDYRDLAQGRYMYGPQVENVTAERDQRTRIEELIYRGESETVEFKREIPQRHDTLLKTVAAFANGQGGTILLGVDKDEDKTIVGVKEPVNAMKDRVTNMIRDNLVPEPWVQLDDIEIDEKRIIAIDVGRGDAPPYGLHADRPIYYVRRGATTFVARQDEVRALGLVNQPGSSRLHGPIG